MIDSYDRPPLGSPRDLVLALVCLLVIAIFAFGCEDGHHSSSDAAAQTPTTTQPVAAPGGATAAASDPLPPGAVRWCYGGFDGSRAQHDARCRISSLRVSPSGLSYKWNSGGCEAIGASGPLDISPVCALFFQSADGSWKGGKFDHISTSRTTRDWKNVHGGYGGWNWGEASAARSFYFVIVSADGKKRSNWAFATGSLK